MQKRKPSTDGRLVRIKMLNDPIYIGVASVQDSFYFKLPQHAENLPVKPVVMDGEELAPNYIAP